MTPRMRKTGLSQGEEFPFTPRWYHWKSARIHYIDEGDGAAVLCLHGNPTWSYLYRDVVRVLRPRFRCIAPDYPGFGCSRAPPGYGFSPNEHGQCVFDLLKTLALERFLVVGHDWGGPIGLWLALQWPERVTGLVLSNTWCWAPTLELRLFSALMGGRWPGRMLETRFNAFARWVLPLGVARRKAGRWEMRRAYRAPFDSPERRLAPWMLARSIRTQGPWLAGIESRLQRFRDKPVSLVWGRLDPLLGSGRILRRWQGYFPQAQVTPLSRAAHYVPEDAPVALADAVAQAFARAPAS